MYLFHQMVQNIYFCAVKVDGFFPAKKVVAYIINNKCILKKQGRLTGIIESFKEDS